MLDIKKSHRRCKWNRNFYIRAHEDWRPANTRRWNWIHRWERRYGRAIEKSVAKIKAAYPGLHLYR